MLKFLLPYKNKITPDLNDNVNVRVYLDNAAATPVDKKVLKTMEPYSVINFGNPSSIYKEGVIARRAVDEARQKIARLLHCHSNEVYFVGSGTESDNLAIQGVVLAYLYKNLKNKKTQKPHVITSAIEHPAVLNTIKELEERGMIEATYISVDKSGLIDLKELKKALLDTTILVSVMYANSEIGTIQSIRDIVKIVREFKEGRSVSYPYVHTDACQAVNYCDTNTELLGVDLMTFNAAKIYGPKGVGALFVRKGVSIEPVIFGGGHESGLRSGTENVSGIVGLATALEITEDMKESETKRLIPIRDHFIKEILEKIPGAILNGDKIARLPNNVHVTIPNIDSDVLVLELDARSVACSAKSACKSNKSGSSVMDALGGKVSICQNGTPRKITSFTRGTLRFSLGRQTRKKDIDRTLTALLDVVEKYKINKP